MTAVSRLIEKPNIELPDCLQTKHRNEKLSDLYEILLIGLISVSRDVTISHGEINSKDELAHTL